MIGLSTMMKAAGNILSAAFSVGYICGLQRPFIASTIVG